MVYTSFVSTEVLPSQERKFRGSMEAEAPPRDIVSDIVQDAMRVDGLPWGKVPPQPRKVSFVRDIVGMAVEGRRAPSVDRLSGSHPTIDAERLDKWYPGNYTEAMALVAKAAWNRAMKGQPAGMVVFSQDFPPPKARPLISDPDPVVGRIGLIQEPGLKLRAVANPNRVMQGMMNPLKDALFKVLKEVPRDCTHDQDRGVDAARNWLQEGKVVHSIDLSDATNLFPLSYQIDLLEARLPEPYRAHLDLFKEAATGKWEWPIKGGHEIVRWNRGQPLGLGPSFASFSLAHHSVAQLACSREPGSDYRILGDDIVICGNKAASEYRRLLHELSCVISEGKSITSSKVAEFAGRIITPRCVMHGFKWRSVSDDSFLDYLSNVGKGGFNHLRPRQRAVAELLAEVPRDFGGLGWNPRGVTWETRYRENRGIILTLATEPSEPKISSSSATLIAGWLAELEAWPAEVHRTIPPVIRGKDGKLGHVQIGDLLDVRLRAMHHVGILEDEFRDGDPAMGYSPKPGTLSRSSKLSLLERRLHPWLSDPKLSRAKRPGEGTQQEIAPTAEHGRKGILLTARREGLEKVFTPITKRWSDMATCPPRPGEVRGTTRVRRVVKDRGNGPSR
jgi:hypothetical protein